ncbi:entericidin A/B family lipoprotein [Silanimonas sp.]|jgi:predicted small secreted protein|uniref:entericidin A/B family lipoprotein n=1 Tax=Silanimonas sp. TaxID=1929290 RepID=UPI0037CC58B0
MIGLALAATLMLGACNTMRGVGKDTEAVGDKIQDEAEQHMADEKKDDGREGAFL